jgi:predicted carbohydrate-binding protein with CBM5 and CBM33 domain
VWSPLEYACHIVDVHRVFEARAALMLAEDNPRFENWDQDATAVAGRYAEQDPATVSGELAGAAAASAARFDAVTGDQWARTGRRGDGAVFTVESLGRYFVHDWTHHLRDVGAAAP